MGTEVDHVHQVQHGVEVAEKENMSFEELSQSMRKIGLLGEGSIENLNFPSKMEFKSFEDLNAISPFFRKSFERATALAILSETRRSMKRIKESYKE